MSLINGVSYSWSMIEFTFGNINTAPAGITSIKYNKNRKTEKTYGVGSDPIGKGHGNIDYTGSITLDMNAQEELRAQSPDGTLSGLGEFDLVVSFARPTGNGDEVKTVVHTIKSCNFNEDGVDASQDDVTIVKDHDLNPGKIDFGQNA